MADLEQRVATLENAAAQNVKNAQSLIDQALKQRAADVKQIADNNSKISAALKGLEQRVSALEKAAAQSVKNVQSLIDQAVKQREADVLQIIENNKQITTALTKLSQTVEANKKATELVDKKLENLKGVMDEMEKRHVKLVATSVENYDKLIRKSIKSECASAVKKKK